MRIQHAILAFALGLTVAAHHARAQASALPAANPDSEDHTADKGRKLIDQMIAALGGDAWLHRQFFFISGQTSHFYKGKPDPYVTGFEEYYRLNPFAERVVYVTHSSTLAILGMPGSNHRDVATVWTDKGGWELTFKGKHEVPKDDEAEFLKVRRHSLDVIVLDWLKQPNVDVTYDGTDMVERRIAQQLTISNPNLQDSVVLKLDESTHLPLSLTFKTRNETYKDFDTETIEYDDYHAYSGIMTPLAVTRYKAGDIISERFLTKVDYTLQPTPDTFDPDANPAQ